MPVYERGKTTWRNRHSHSQAHPWQTHTSFFCHACLWKRQDPWRNGHSQTHNTSYFSFFSICIYERGKTHGEISIFLTLTQTHNTSSLISCLFMKEANPMELWLSSPPQSHTSVFSTPVYEISKTHGEMGPRDSLSHTHPRHTKPVRKLKEAKPMKKLAPETHSHAHPRHAKTSLGNWKRHNYQNKIKTTWPILVKVRHWSWKQWSINYPLLLSSKTMHKNIS